MDWHSTGSTFRGQDECRVSVWAKEDRVVDRQSNKPNKVLRIIDTINEKVGRFICFAFIAIMLIQIMEVVLRYIFNNPTIWAWDVNSQLFTGAAILGGGYVLLHDAHVRLDLLYSRVNPRTKLIFDLISLPLIIMAFIIIIWKGGEMALLAWETKAHARSYFAPILWPVKSVLFVGAFLLLLQAVSNYTHIIASIRKPTSKASG